MMSRSTLIAVAAALALAAAGVRWLAPGGDGSAPHVLRPDDARLLALGERTYATHCAACHGARLQGQPEWRTRSADGLLPAPPHDASGHTWHHPDETLFRITKFGVASVIGDPSYKTAMPAYDGVLSDERIVAVLSWIKAQWPAPIRQKHDEVNAHAAKAGRAASSAQR